MIRKQIIFKGRVQGVGFRFIAIRYAQFLGLTGWVRNEYDGTVLMEVQGENEKIAQLISYLRNDQYIRIDSYKQKVLDIKENESGFGLKGY
jgi:acylphosphatase